MKEWKIDVAVLCIFFARPEVFAKSFECVRKARPKVLLLWQDGPRENRPDDVDKINKCREIAKNIDWDCEVHTNYHDKNMGCDPSTHLSHKWAFSIVDKCIILEDDLVVSDSFFAFCKEMLDKYENDERIDSICGTNVLGKYDIPNDYFFSRMRHSWGWATWKRVAEKWESDYKFAEDYYAMNCIDKVLPEFDRKIKWNDNVYKRKQQGIPYWEFIVHAECMLNNRVNIYPKVNMVNNIGFGDNATHNNVNSLLLLPKKTRMVFNTKTYELDFPLNAPKYIISDEVYNKKMQKKLLGGKIYQFFRFPRRVYYKILRIVFNRKRGK